MPKKKQVDLRRIRKQEERRLRNRSVRSAVKTFSARAVTAMEPSPAEDEALAQAELRQAVSALDRAARKGIIHRNNAARRKSHLMRRYNESRPSPTEAAASA